MNENSLARFRQRYLGFVFQSYNLMNSMTALENVEFPLVFKRVKTKNRKKMARDMLTKVGLESRISHRPKEMSGGQQQRVGIARAFVAKPEIVFADEPTGNLDTKTAMEVMTLIKNIARDNNQTIVMVTHDRRVAEFADKIIHILDGKIQNIEIVRDISKKVEDTVGKGIPEEVEILEEIEIPKETEIPEVFEIPAEVIEMQEVKEEAEDNPEQQIESEIAVSETDE
jgi:putative ABC transport system ATP-binding protein